MQPPLGFGVSAGYGAAILEPLAATVEALGYESFWVNDSGRPDADGLADLAVVARAAPGLRLGVGVVPLDRRPPERVTADLERLGLPLDRVRVGLGSGSEAQRPIGLVRAGVAELRRAIPAAVIFIAALGPRMSELAGEVADGVLLNWAVPERLVGSVARIRRSAAAAGRDPASVDAWTYVRAAVGPDARARLGGEAERYARSPAYGRQFAEMGVPLDAVGVAGDDLPAQLGPYRDVMDGVVVRALPAATAQGNLLEELVEIARSAVD